MHPFLLALATLPPLVISSTPVEAAGRPAYVVAPPNVNIVEGQAGTVRLCKGGGNGRPTTISFGTADGSANANLDYVPINSAASVSSCVNITVQTKPDNVVEGSEGFTLNYLIPSNGYRATTLITIIDVPPPPPPPPAATVQPVSVNENAGSATVHVLRSGSLTQPSSASYQTSGVTAVGGINYTDVSGTLSWAAGQADASFQVPIKDDGQVTGNLQFNVLLGNFVNATLGSNGPVTVVNTDVVPPPPPPPPPPGGGLLVIGHATAISACAAINRPENIMVGDSYNVVGYAGYVPIGGSAIHPAAGTQDVVLLNDATHLGDGYSSLWVDRSCVTVGP